MKFARIGQLPILALVATCLLAACASKKVSLDEPAQMDKTLNTTTGDRSEKVGVRGDSIVVQRKIYLEEQMTKVKDQIEDLENSIYGQSVQDPGGLWLSLQDCRKRLADPRVGGNGNPEPMETWEKLSQSDPDFDFRVDKKSNVVAVTEEDLGQKISNYNKMKNVLQRRYSEYKTKSDSCENKYRTALVQHGLNPEDTQAQGEWVDGPEGRVWKMRQPKTKDPEELMRRKAKREKQRGTSSEGASSAETAD